MEHSDLSRFGLTCELLTADHGEALLTWFLEGFRARTSAVPVKAQGWTARVRAYGQKWRASWAKFDRGTYSWKTAQCSLLGDSELFLETWPRWGSMRNGECLERMPLAPLTSASASGSLLPTPTLITCEHPGRQKIKPGQQDCTTAWLARRDGWLRGGQWSPSHAAWTMGWPESWTNLGRSAMVKYHKWLQQHGAS